MKKYKIGYTQGAFDMFHIGHLRLLQHAKELCDVLIVGVNSDELINSYKSKTAVIPEKERVEIINAVKYVDRAFIVTTLDKTEILNQTPFDVVFIGNDWKGSERWNKTESDLNEKGVEVVYLEYTQGISSSIIRKRSKIKNS